MATKSGTGGSTSAWSFAASSTAADTRDNLKPAVNYGDGYGTQVKGGPTEGVFGLDDSVLETIGVFGTYGGIQYFWPARFHSNLVFGHVEIANPDLVDGESLKSTTYGAAEFIWNPFATTRFGFEYLWGRRQEENGESGTSSRFLLSSRFVF